MHLYYIDYYFIFILTFLIISVTVYNKTYIIFKISETIISKNNHFKMFIYCFLLMFFFILLNFLSFFTANIDIFIKLNYTFIYKFFLYIFSFFFLFLLKHFSDFSKFFSFEAVWIFAFSLFSLSVLFQVDSFLYFYVILESYSLAILSVLVMKKLTRKLLNASFYYLIINIVTSCIILYNISLIYFSCGILTLVDINDCLLNLNKLQYSNLLMFNLVSIILCFFVKLSVFPFSLILQDIYSNLPYVFVFFFLIIPKFCFSVFIFSNFAIVLNSFSYLAFYLFTSALLLTSFVHALFSVKDINIKNLIINTSFSNAPFLLAPLFCKNFFLIVGFFNFTVIYFFNLFCFFCLLFLICVDFNQVFKRFVNIFGIFYSNVALSFSILIFFLSLSSLPPFSGFFAKFYLFYFFVEYKMFFVYFLLSFINLLIVYSYLKIFKNIFIKKKNFYIKNFYTKNIYLVYIVTFFSIFNILFIFFFDFFYKLIFVLVSSVLFC